MLSNLLYVLILVMAFPAGYLLAWLARDELVAGRKWFILLAVISVIATIPFVILSQIKLSIILTLFFIAIISLVATWKSYDKAFLGRKFAKKEKWHFI